MKTLQICFVGLPGSGKTTAIKKIRQKVEHTDENIEISSFKQGDALVYLLDAKYDPRNIKPLLAIMHEADACVFCISGQEGIKPQLGELIILLDYVKINNGIILITKTDSTDDVDALKNQIKRILAQSSLKNAEILGTSSLIDEGFTELREEIVKLNQKHRDAAGKFRLPVESVVESKGMVSVNGVVLSGSVKKYDKTVLMPWGKEFIVQDVLVEGIPVGQAKIGDRVTILYKGLYYHDVQTGDVSSVEGVFHKGKKLKFELHINAFFKDDIRPETEVQLNIGLQTLPVTITRITKDNAEVGRATTNEKVEVEVESKLPFAFEKGQQCIVYNPEAHWRSIKVVGAGTMKEGA